MLDILLARVKQGHRTVSYPQGAPTLPDRFRGVPAIDPSKCGKDCGGCAGACPAGALSAGADGVRLDMGRCLFCGECAEKCPGKAVTFTRDHQLSASRREDLIVGGEVRKRTVDLDAEMRRLFGRSLKLRQVSAGGCNACEADLNVLSTVVFDLGRFGIQFVASPRHADGIVVTGPVTQNMRLALQKTYDAVPAPKIVIAVGACAISGGIYGGHPEQCNGVGDMFPVHLYIPGCPPHPITILDGLLRLLGQIA
jgi:Ni,Fe-hydrogenase III small subunit/formate hydrogenlyase subunit 6/NADH:ubiquinone oxidoreductase subunit I